MDTRIVVKRRQYTVYGTRNQGTNRGSGYCEDHLDQQFLIKEWRLFGIRIWSRELDYEDVPVYASAQAATMGFTDWKSRFAEFI